MSRTAQRGRPYQRMSTEQYLEQAAALGIGRGSLAGRFPEEDGPLGNPAIGHERSLINRDASRNVNQATLGLPVEDLTHLNPARSGSKGGYPRGLARRRERSKP